MNNEEINELKKQKDELLQIAEIREKDVLDLTEEEIVLLAKSRVHGDRSFMASTGEMVRQKGTTFEEEYRKILDLIEQKKSVPKR